MTIPSCVEDLRRLSRLIDQGFSSSEIKENMHIGISTIETYRSRIKENMGLKNNAALVKHAIQWFHNSEGK